MTFVSQLLLKSTDGGLTWAPAPGFPNFKVCSLGISPLFAGDGTVFAATAGGGLYRSTDRGSSWANVESPAMGKHINAVAVSPNFGEDGTVFAANLIGQLFKSVDGGDSWSRVTSQAAAGSLSFRGGLEARQSSAAPHKTIIAFSPDYRFDETVFASIAGSSLFKSTDAGESWVPAVPGLGSLMNFTSLALSPDYGQDQTLAAGIWGGGVLISRNGGISWDFSNGGIQDKDVAAVAFSPRYAADQSIFSCTATGQVYLSTSGGTLWQQRSSIPRPATFQTGLHCREILPSPNYGTDFTVFLSTFEGFWRSSNAGLSWRYSETLPARLVRSMALSPEYENDQTVVCATYGGGMIRSSDGGQSWATLNTGLVNPYPDPHAVSPEFPTDQTAFVGTAPGPLISVDGLETWTLTPVLNTPVFARTLAVSPAFGSDRTVAVGTDNLLTGFPLQVVRQGRLISTNGLFLSTDGGSSWNPTGLSGVGLHSISFSPQFASDATLFAASLYDGLHKSVNGGLSWIRPNIGIAGCCLFRVMASPDYNNDQTLIIAKSGGLTGTLRGLYRSSDGGLSWSLVPPTSGLTVLNFDFSPAFADDGTIFVATLERGVLKSEDWGLTAAPTSLDKPYATALRASPAYCNDRTVFAANYEGVFRSQDGGGSWTSVLNSIRNEEVRPNLVKDSDWLRLSLPESSAQGVLAASQASAGAQFTFAGTGVAWIGDRGPKRGIALVFVDGTLAAAVDLYAPVYLAQQTLFEISGLPFGEHALDILVTGTRNPLSQGEAVSIDAFDVHR